jgi:hypothetical protein
VPVRVTARGVLLQLGDGRERARLGRVRRDRRPPRARPGGPGNGGRRRSGDRRPRRSAPDAGPTRLCSARQSLAHPSSDYCRNGLG